MNANDRLLDALARVARKEMDDEQQQVDERWDALAAGELDDASAAQLRTSMDSLDEQARTFEAFRPFDADFDRRLVEAARQELDAREHHVQPPQRTGKILRGPWQKPAVAALLAAAASLVVLVRAPQPVEPLPGYEMRLEGDVRAMRSTEPATSVIERRIFVPGNRLRLVLTPDATITGLSTAQAWLVAGERVTELTTPLVSEDGAVLFEADVKAAGESGPGVELPFGHSTLLIATGRPGEIPSGIELVTLLEGQSASRDESWAAWAVDLRLEPED